MEDTNTTPETQVEVPSLSVGDIMLLKQIIEVANSRGAFQATELTTVGLLYDKMSTWLASVAPVEQPVINDDESETQGENNA
jgi:hypothetical protein